MIVDETTYVVTKYQGAVSISLSTADGLFNAEENFIGFYNTSSTASTAEALTEVMKDVLLHYALKLMCCGQTYDDAAAMSDVNLGVATRIHVEEKCALNTKCLAHYLNLTVQDATKSHSLTGDVLMAVQELKQSHPFSCKMTYNI
jgi:hypothetical protein